MAMLKLYLGTQGYLSPDEDYNTPFTYFCVSPSHTIFHKGMPVVHCLLASYELIICIDKSNSGILIASDNQIQEMLNAIFPSPTNSSPIELLATTGIDTSIATAFSGIHILY